MNYKFPYIKTIEDVLPSIHGREEFKVVKRDGYTVIDYVFNLPDTFNDIIRRECRGITFDDNGDIISRPFHKFFNLGEREETLPHNVDFSKPHFVLIKADGSMVRPVLVNGEVVPMTRMGHTVPMTRMGHTDVARQAFDEIDYDFPDDKAMRGYLNDNLTPIYEFVSPNNKIVLEYDKPRLILLAVRDNFTGEYLPAHSQEIGTDLLFMSGQHVQEHIKAVTDKIEGYVIRFEDGHMIKVKTEEYLRYHRGFDILRFEKDVLQLILNGHDDDVSINFSETTKKRLEEYKSVVFLNLGNMIANVTLFLRNNSELAPKEFAAKVMETYPSTYQGLVFNMARRNEKSGWDIMKDFVLRHTGSSGRVEQIRDLIGAEWKYNPLKENE